MASNNVSLELFSVSVKVVVILSSLSSSSSGGGYFFCCCRSITNKYPINFPLVFTPFTKQKKKKKKTGERTRKGNKDTNTKLFDSLSLSLSSVRDVIKEVFFLSNKFVQKEILKNFNREGGEFLCVSLSLSDVTSFILMMMMIRTCAILHIRIANRVVKDSCCRGGIVHIRGVFSCALFVRPESSKALWRFRVSTSNSPSGRSRPHAHTPNRYIYQNYAQQGIRVCGDDHFQPQKWQ